MQVAADAGHQRGDTAQKADAGQRGQCGGRCRHARDRCAMDCRCEKNVGRKAPRQHGGLKVDELGEGAPGIGQHPVFPIGQRLRLVDGRRIRRVPGERLPVA